MSLGTRAHPLRVALASALLAVYGVLSFAGATGQSLVSPNVGESIAHWPFPAVVQWLELGRIGCLAIGAWLLSGLLSRRDPPTRVAWHCDDPGRAGWLLATLAGGAFGAGCFAQVLTPAAQAALLIALFTPALGWLWLERRTVSIDTSAPQLAAAIVVVAVWLLVWGAPTLATPLGVEHTGGFSSLQRALDSEFNLLRDPIGPGVTGLPLAFLGEPFLGLLGVEPSSVVFQCVGACWLALAGMLIGHVSGHAFGPPTAPVAAAVLLFSPPAMIVPAASPLWFVGPTIAVTALCLLEASLRTTKPSAFVALGAAAGVATTIPPIAPIAVLAFGYAATREWRRIPWSAFAAAWLLYAAVIATAAPAWIDGLDGLGFPISGSAQPQAVAVSAVEPVRPSDHAPLTKSTQTRGGEDLPGHLLASFATSQTTLLSIDGVAFDPIGGALAAVGLFGCLRRGRGREMALLGLLALAWLPGIAVSYDRPNPIHTTAVPVAVALLAAYATGQLAQGLRLRRLPLLASVGVIAGGLILGHAQHDDGQPQSKPATYAGSARGF